METMGESDFNNFEFYLGEDSSMNSWVSELDTSGDEVV